MSDKNTSSGRNLLRTVASPNLGDAVFGIAEVALDSNMADGVLKEIPIVGTLIKLVRAGQSISEEIFIRKLVRFLTELKDIPVEERQKLLEQYPDGSAQQQILGENLLLAIERLDDVEKPSILARFFIAFVKSEIDYVTFTRLARSLEKFNLSLLPELRWFYDRTGSTVDTPEEIVHELSLAGLVTVGLAGSGTIGGSAGYRFSTLGEAFVSIGFKT